METDADRRYAALASKDITLSGTAIAMVITALVLLLTLSTQIWRVVNSNPTNGLKVE
jgi:hypothetical protein